MYRLAQVLARKRRKSDMHKVIENPSQPHVHNFYSASRSMNSLVGCIELTENVL